MRRLLKKTAAVLLASMIALSCMFMQAFAEESGSESSGSSKSTVANNGQMNLDVVFVLDASGSMRNSDPKKIAIDAYRLFVDLLDDTCGIGYVVFTHELLDTGEIVETSDKTELEKTKKKMAAVKYDLNGFTDIALGLTKAKDMLTTPEIEADRREKLVILLTDGNTALPKGGRSLEDSNDEMDATLLALHDRQIPVYTIGLNYNGKMKADELQRISDETEGDWKETHSSEELVQIFSGVFATINNVSGIEENVEDGKMTIEVTDSTVSDVNLIIRSALTLDQLDPVLVSPSGETIQLNNSDLISVSTTGNYTMLKLTKPQEGEWTLQFNGADTSGINVTRMDYYSVYLEQQIREVLMEGEGISIKDYLPKGAKVSIEATVRDQDGIVTDKKLLNTLNLVAKIAKENGKVTTLPMIPSPEEGKYMVEWTVDDTTKAAITTAVENTKFKKETAGDVYTVLPISEYSQKMLSTGQYTQEYYENAKLSDGRTGDQAWSVPEDSGNAGFTVIILIIAIAMVIGGIVVGVIIRSKMPEKALGGEVKFQEPAPEKEREKPKQPFVPEKPIVMPEAKDPDLVNYELVEHEEIEKLIKKGPEDAFAANADAYQTDEALEAIVKKGPDNVFAVGTDKLPEEMDEDEYGEEDESEYGQLDDQYEDDDDDDYGDDDGSGMGGYDPNAGYAMPQQGYGMPMNGYDPNTGYGVPSQGYGMPMNGYGPNTGYGVPPQGYGMPQQGYGMPNPGYGMPMNGYDPNTGYGVPPQGYGMPNNGYDPNTGYGMPNGGDTSGGGYDPNGGQ